ncbi:type I-E CRISPR-associated protein Cas7/Cse4/CasC [Arcanobacterium haemolyticum]|nr:type I-E CRISPR-associated protein Cas7/Cse4/CasC [Arcanobacterium haemolyticum]
MTTFVDLHIIQNLPPSCVNRDDSGSPKTAVFGGVRRLRVSSQSWKSAARKFFNNRLTPEEVGIRTKRVVELLAKKITAKNPELTDNADTLAAEVFRAAKIKLSVPRGKEGATEESGYLLFLATSQLNRLADLAITSHTEGTALDAKEIKKIFKEAHAVDIALFGRMVADSADLNIDASCQVAHAISTHAAENEYDFFTAVDDEKKNAEDEDAGAGMMGTVEFSSATMYRYATVNLDQLSSNLGNKEATLRAVEEFIRAFSLSMPTGKQNTFANRTLPEAIVVTVRDDQPISYAGAFEDAIRSTDGYTAKSIDALAAYAHNIESAYGMKPLESFVVSVKASESVSSLGTKVTFADLPAKVTETVAPRLSEENA